MQLSQWRARHARLHIAPWHILLIGLMLLGIWMTLAGSFQST